MAEILLRFIRGTAFDSRLIEWGTWSWCSHVEAIAPDGRTLGAQLKGGVKYREPSDSCYKGIKRQETWHIPCTDNQYANFHYFLHQQVGTKYDWFAIAGIAIRKRDWREPSRWVCSELDAAAFEQIGLLKFGNIPKNWINPGDVYLLIQQIPGAYLP